MRLSEKDKKDFYGMIDSWGSGVHGAPAPVDYILRFWEESKSEHLFNLFGNKLILSKEVNYEKGPDELMNILYENNDFYQAFMNFRRILNAEDKSFMSADNFVKNEIGSEYICAGRTYPAGTKFSKLLALWGNLYDRPQQTEELINIISRIRQTHKSKGFLSLSIHPQDYLTASVNEYGWNSCLDFYGGEYARGCVCAMNSPYLVVAYLTNTLGRWDNKRWRQFYIVSKDLIVPIKQYPYEDSHLERIATEWLRELSGGNFKFKQELSTRFMTQGILYNDLKTEKPYGYLREGAEEPATLWFDGRDECLICGEEGWFYDEGQIYCNDCALICSQCGCVVNWDSELHRYTENGEFICSECCYVI